jgi:hypothetical protein
MTSERLFNRRGRLLVARFIRISVWRTQWPSPYEVIAVADRVEKANCDALSAEGPCPGAVARYLTNLVSTLAFSLR